MKPREAPTAEELLTLFVFLEMGTVATCAGALCVSPHTVDSRFDSLRRKSGRSHMPQVVAWVYENDWFGQHPGQSRH